ncbi:MAG: type III pantothenate kinase [Salinivenus sp.]
MFLALDIGNSAAKGGLFDEDVLETSFSIELPSRPTAPHASDAWAEALGPSLDGRSVEHVGLVSVVPRATAAASAALRTLTGAPVTRIQADAPLPFALDYETPGTLGTDRLAAAAAGWVLYGRPDNRSVLVVDTGTAVSYEVVHRDAVYQGGAIGAGPALARRALQTGTAQLPDVPLTLPAEPVGRSTEAALQSGIMWGLVDSVRGMTNRLAATLPDAPLLILTGGWSSVLARHLDRTDVHAPHLVLQGARLLAETDW